jgi:hypothetical protein
MDRQYSPSTGMDRSVWEIILEELYTHGYIVENELRVKMMTDELLCFMIALA